MPEPVNPVTPQQAAKNREDDFARAQARREEIAQRLQQKVAGRVEEDEEPTFTFRAQDILSVMVLDHYARLVEMYEPNSDKLVRIVDELNKFRAWQQANPGKVKLPD